MNKKIVLARRPNGYPVIDDFRMEMEDIPTPQKGELLLKNLYISLSPGDRLKMNKVIELDSVIGAHTIAKVLEPNDSRIFSKDDLVLAKGGWQEFFTASPNKLKQIKTDYELVTEYLSVLGSPGLTAYFGTVDVGKPLIGKTVLISGASGVIGSIVGQIAKIKGCYVVGICKDNDEKRRWLLNDIHFDAIANEADLGNSLLTVCPNGIDIFYDNVGGEILDAVLRLIAKKGRNNACIVCCGMISQYNRPKNEKPYSLLGLHTVINRRVRIEGFIVGDYRDRHDSALKDLKQWLQEGKIKYKEDISFGLENAPNAFIRSMKRSSFGQTLIKLD